MGLFLGWNVFSFALSESDQTIFDGIMRRRAMMEGNEPAIGKLSPASAPEIARMLDREEELFKKTKLLFLVGRMLETLPLSESQSLACRNSLYLALGFPDAGIRGDAVMLIATIDKQRSETKLLSMIGDDVEVASRTIDGLVFFGDAKTASGLEAELERIRNRMTPAEIEKSIILKKGRAAVETLRHKVKEAHEEETPGKTPDDSLPRQSVSELAEASSGGVNSWGRVVADGDGQAKPTSWWVYISGIVVTLGGAIYAISRYRAKRGT